MFEDNPLKEIVKPEVRVEVRKKLVVELQDKLREMGVTRLHVSWSQEFIDRVAALPPGPDREALKDEGVREFLKMLEAVENGDCEPLVFGDATPKRPPEEIEAILRERGMKADW